jgi:hypothetical protein
VRASSLAQLSPTARGALLEALAEVQKPKDQAVVRE